MLITPKLHIPPLRAKMLARTHLVERLAEGRRNRLIVVTGPAGSGKTSLVCQWINETSVPSAWYALDESDNDPDLFFRYFLTAVGAMDHPLAIELAPWRQGQKRLSGPEVLSMLAEPLSRTAADIFVTIDDYHLIDCPEIHDFLVKLLSLTLPKLHLILISRRSLPFSISRLKVRDQVTEISFAEMKFSTSETEAFFKEILPVSLSADQLQELTQHMDGWVGGLQLLGLSLQGKQSIKSVSDILDRGYQEAADYLIEEVLDTQPEHVRSFLYITALLERFNHALCREVTQLADVGDMIEYVYRSNLFLVRQDTKGGWYNYHPIFSRALREKFEHADPGTSRSVYYRASLWFAHNGLLEDAFRHAFASGDLEFAADLLEDHLLALFENFEIPAYRRWLSKLPKGILARRPLLRLQDCRVKLEAAELSDVAAILEDIGSQPQVLFKRYDVAKRRQCEEYLLVLNRILPYWFDPENADTGEIETVLQQISTGNKPLCALHTLIPFSHMFKGQLALSEKSLRAISDTVFASESRLANMIWFRVASTVERMQGHLHKAEMVLNQALLFSDYRGRKNVQLKFMLDLPMAWIGYQRNDLEKALTLATSVSRYVEQTPFVYEVADVNYLLGLIHLAKGQSSLAEQCLHRMQWAAGVIGTPSFKALADARLARFALQQGDLGRAVQWLQHRQLGLDEPFSLRFSVEALACAQILTSQGRRDPADQVLQTLRERCIAHHMLETVIEVDLLRAVNCHATGDLVEAQTILRTLVQQAGAEGYVRPFVDHAAEIGPELWQLSAESASDVEKSVLNTLLATCGYKAADGLPNASFPSPQIGHLTRREMDILSLIAQGYRNKQIAEKTYISLHTVKTHVKNIFEKLEVKTRVQAIRKAQELQSGVGR